MNEEYEFLNAVIESASISIERGLLTAWIILDYGGSGQGFGGHALYVPKNFTHHKTETKAGHYIYRIMEIAGVDSWDDLKGKTIRVKKGTGFNDLIVSIGHIVKDLWFCPKEE
jgi:hypothetical protein